MTPRLALLRWVWRVVRREKRQHLFVTLLVAFGITIATVLVGGAAAISTPKPEGLGIQVADEASDADRDAVVAVAEDLSHDYPAIGLTFERLPERGEPTLVGVWGAAQDGDRFDLQEGAWPEVGEVALTKSALDLLAQTAEQAEATGSTGQGELSVGDIVAIEGEQLTISGIWQDRTSIRSEAVLLPSSELSTWSLVAMTGVDTESAAVSDQVDDLMQTLDAFTPFRFRDDVHQGGETTMALAGGTLLALQIAVLASAGFSMLAQRRARQLGMLAAMGAPPQLLGSVVRLTGLVVGVIGGLIGLTLGIGMTLALTPVLQAAVEHRINPLALPWPYLLSMLPLAVGTAVAAAWLPARRVARQSVLDAVAARRPSEGKVMPRFLLGAVLLATGTWAMIDGAPKQSPPHIVGAVIGVVVGALLVVPASVSLLGRTARWLPLPLRIGWREVDRNRSRSASVVAAATMAIAIPFGLATMLASLDRTWIPVVPDDIVVAHIHIDGSDPWRNPGPKAEQAAVMQSLADMVPGSRPLIVEGPANWYEDGGETLLLRESIEITRRSDPIHTSVAVATPELIEAMGLEGVAPEVDLVITELGDPVLPEDVTVEYRRPKAYVLPNAVLMRPIDHFASSESIVIDTYLVKPGGFTDEELARLEAATEEAIAGTSADIWFHMPEVKPPLVAVRAGALTVAGLLGLGVVTASIALVRAENAAEGRTLNAIGAPAAMSRLMGAAVSMGMVYAAVAVAVPATFLLLAGVFLNPDELFSFVVPWMELGGLVLALPLLAGLFGAMLTTTRVDRLST
jgi:putative ABC transport system permease protein